MTINTSTIGSIVDVTNSEVQYYGVINLQGTEGTSAGVQYNLVQNRYQFRSTATDKAYVGARGLVLYEPHDSGVEVITIEAPSSVSGAYSLVLPSAIPTSNSTFVVDISGGMQFKTAIITNLSSFSSDGYTHVLYAKADGTVDEIARMIDNQLLVGNTAGAPQVVTLAADSTGTDWLISGSTIKVQLSQDLTNTASPSFAGLYLTTFDGVVKAVSGTFSAAPLVNADVDAAAAIDFSKLASLPAAKILVGNASNVATAVNMSGDVTIDASGNTDVAASVILDQVLSGLVSGSGAILATDTVLQAFGKVQTSISGLATGNLSGDTAISVSGGTGAVVGSGVVLTLADASSSGRGAVTTGSQSFAGLKTFLSGLESSSGINITGNSVVQGITGNTLNITGDSNLAAITAQHSQVSEIVVISGISGSSLSVTGDSIQANISGTGLYVSGNVELSGTVDGLDVSGHTHDGSASGGQQLPLTSLETVSGNAYDLLMRDSSGAVVSDYYIRKTLQSANSSNIGSPSNAFAHVYTPSVEVVSTPSNIISIQPPAGLSASYVLKLPLDDGNNNELLKTDGSGNLSWTTISSVGMTNPMTLSGDMIYAAMGGPTVQEITRISAVTSASGELGGKYFRIDSPVSGYYVWIEESSGSTDPSAANPGRTGIKVTSVSYSPNQIATQIEDTLKGNQGGPVGVFTTSSDTGTVPPTVTITCVLSGAVPDAVDGDTNMSFAVLQQGADSQTSTPSALHIGTSGQVLRSDGTFPVWGDDVGFANPMSTSGAMIIGGTSGAPSALAAGTSGQVLTISEGVPSWQTPSTAANTVTGTPLITGTSSASSDVFVALGQSGTPVGITLGAGNYLIFARATAFFNTPYCYLRISTSSSSSTSGQITNDYLTYGVGNTGAGFASTCIAPINITITGTTSYYLWGANGSGGGTGLHYGELKALKY
jgi:hypothetical protein